MQAHHQDDVLESFKAMDRMWLAIVLDHGDDAGEVHDELFGSSDWISRLQALSERLSEFQRRWHGPAITIDNFAVTSGHEAAAMFAARLVAYAPTRARWIVTHRAELDRRIRKSCG